jgi:hypothetical protein
MMNHEKRQKKTEVRNTHEEVSIKQNHLSLEVTADDKIHKVNCRCA